LECELEWEWERTEKVLSRWTERGAELEVYRAAEVRSQSAAQRAWPECRYKYRLRCKYRYRYMGRNKPSHPPDYNEK
jgi:hypothetical protein